MSRAAPLRGRILPAFAPALAIIMPVACTGSASIHMIPLDARRISTTEPLVVHVKPDECYYWVNERDQLCVTMRYDRRSVFGAAHSESLYASLVLDGVPAGTGRNYIVDRHTARVRYSDGGTHARAASLQGIVGVWGYQPGRVLEGRFRFNTKQQYYFVLTGWSGDRRVLYLGEFRAIPDRAAAEAIFERTQRDGMGHDEVHGGTVAVQPAQPAEPVEPDERSTGEAPKP